MPLTRVRQQITRATGIALCALSCFVLVGWATGSASMVRVIPGSVAMSINTALMFLMSGIALDLYRRGRTGSLLFTALASAIVLLSSAILTEHLFGVDLHIDLASVHRTIGDGHANPGRSSLNGSVGFLCAGLALLLTRTPPQHAARRLALPLSLLSLAIGVAGLLGYLLGLEAMYRIASLNRMAVFTALGMTTLGLGLWSIHAKESGVSSVHDEAKRITRLAATLLVLFAFVTGLTSFALLRGSFEQSTAQLHVHAARTAAASMGALLRETKMLSSSIAQRPSLLAAMQALAADGKDSTGQAQLNNAARTFADAGFSATITGIGGQLLYQNGSLPSLPPQSVQYGNGPDKAILSWDQGFRARQTHQVIAGGSQVGTIVSERQLNHFDNIFDELTRASASADVVLCAMPAERISCFPSRFYPAGLNLFGPTAGGAAQLPISRALRGESGSTSVKDVRGVPVITGYAGLPFHPFGLVVKTDVSELYLPLREKLYLLFGAVALFVVIGTALLRSWVQPLIVSIVEQRERIKGILDHANDAFIAIGPDGRVTDWNAQAEQTFGISAKEAIGKELATLIIPPRYREAHHIGFARYLHSGTGPAINNRIELAAMHASGHEISVELSVTPFRQAGGLGASAFLRDLTGRKDAEAKAAQQARDIEEARLALSKSQRLEAVGKLTGGIAHDFNNMLQVMRGNLELIAQDGDYLPTMTKRLHSTLEAIERGAKLSAQLLAFARRQPLQPQATNIARVVTAMDEMLQGAVGEAIEIELIISDSLGNALVDPSQLEHVILNLAINARDAMQAAGKLTIKLENAVLDEDDARKEPGLEAGVFVLLAISDSGCGMSKEVMEIAFEPFFTTKPEGEDTGLGLSMAYGFAKQSNGHIVLDSEPGSGTTVRIYLPRTYAPETIRPQATSHVAERGQETILVVEDDRAVQATVMQLLTGLGYTVLKADHASQALEMLEAGARVDLLFTDVVMPGPLRSPELARRARMLLPELRVLFTSGFTHDAIVHGGRLDPGVELLSKPYSRDQLASKVRTVMLASDPPHATPAPIDRPSGLIAFVEDNEDFRMLGLELIKLLGFEAESFGSAEDALAPLRSGRFDVLISDVGLPGMSGVELATLVASEVPGIELILATGYGEALATRPPVPHQILSKPFSIQQLQACLEAAINP